MTRLVSLLLIAAVLILSPIVDISPADPTWLAGYWDGHDFDEIILLIEAIVAVVPTLPMDLAPTYDVVASVGSIDRCVIPVAVDDTAAPRAPPLTASAV